MKHKSAKIVVLLGFAALGAWIALRRKNHPSFRNNSTWSGLEIDDDTEADIIRRALPELERARQLAVAR